MNKHHHHHHSVSGKNLFWTIVLNIIITLLQIIGGAISGSLALLSDAMHNFSDVLALLIAYVANRLSSRPNDESKTFGYKRAEILATFINASVLFGIGLFLIVEAAQKLYHPEIINSLLVIALGIFSIVLNTLSVLLIKDDAHNNMNIKAAYLHLLTDVMTSVAVVVGGVVIYYFHIFWIDSLISILIAIYLIISSVDLIKQSSAILMQFSPKEVDINKIIALVKTMPEIKDIHHIHIWKINEHQIHFEAHLDFKEDLALSVSNKIIEELEKKLHLKFGIEHTTFQCEYNTKHSTKKIAN